LKKSQVLFSPDFFLMVQRRLISSTTTISTPKNFWPLETSPGIWLKASQASRWSIFVIFDAPTEPMARRTHNGAVDWRLVGKAWVVGVWPADS